MLNQNPAAAFVIVDSVRLDSQIDAIRQAYGPRVFHIHLHASDAVLANRYHNRQKDLRELGSYDDVREDKTELHVSRLAKIADVVIDSERCTELDVLIRSASHLGLFGREYLRLVDVLVGALNTGSRRGKGHLVSFLAREYEILVRVGGPNAGHTVYEEPKAYTFHHLPSGSRSSDARLAIGPGAVLYVPTLLREIGECEIDAKRLSIDPQAMIISESDRQQGDGRSQFKISDPPDRVWALLPPVGSCNGLATRRSLRVMSPT